MKLDNALEGAFNLVTYPDARLTTVCTLCVPEDLELVKMAHRPMLHIMKAYNGIGLSANQVGITKRFCLLAVGSTAPKALTYEDTVMLINPEVIDTEETTDDGKEGCLSLPSFSEQIIRPTQVTIAYRDIEFKECKAVFVGLEARCVLHEIDHLNGILQLDKLSLMRQEMYKKKLQKNRRHGKITI